MDLEQNETGCRARRGESTDDGGQTTEDSESNSQFVEWSNGYEWLQ
jgi:hypothetical protein